MRIPFIPIEDGAQAAQRARRALAEPSDYLTERAQLAVLLLDAPDAVDPATGQGTHALARGAVVAIEAERLRLKIVFAQAGPRFA